MEDKSFKDFSIFSSGGHPVQWSRTVWAILVDSHLRNILVKLFQNLSTNLAEEVVKSLFLFIAPAAKRSEIVWAILVESHPRNIPV